jgi:hypothetical protein
MEQRFQIGIDAWIIQDGNYGDFTPGRHDFAVEFYPESAQSLPATAGVSAKRIRGSRYEIVGRVSKVLPRAWVIDIGLLAYQNHPPPPWAREGTYFKATVYLGVDPFFYFEELADLSDMPELIYPWEIERIELETTPWLTSRDPQGRQLQVRDVGPTSFSDVKSTNAWHDDSGHGHYVLTARAVGQPKKRLGDR